MSLQAAIEKLRRSLTTYKATEWYPHGCNELRRIITILEAAEKVDKKNAIDLMNALRFFLIPKDKRDEDFIKAWNQIKVLLFALPDKE